MHDQAQLGVRYPGAPWLSADGRRLLLYAPTVANASESIAMYADRDAVDQPFSPAVALDGVPAAPDMFMTEDCSRVYMTALQHIFYVQQL